MVVGREKNAQTKHKHNIWYENSGVFSKNIFHKKIKEKRAPSATVVNEDTVAPLWLPVADPEPGPLAGRAEVVVEIAGEGLVELDWVVLGDARAIVGGGVLSFRSILDRELLRASDPLCRGERYFVFGWK